MRTNHAGEDGKSYTPHIFLVWILKDGMRFLIINAKIVFIPLECRLV